MSAPGRELDRIMRQPPTPFSESRALARRILDEQRREAQARLRAKRGVLVFSTEVDP
jgi:tRNA G46 methylase TrmB